MRATPLFRRKKAHDTFLVVVFSTAYFCRPGPGKDWVWRFISSVMASFLVKYGEPRRLRRDKNTRPGLRRGTPRGCPKCGHAARLGTHKGYPCLPLTVLMFGV
jgi:hypothetical protein